MLASTNRIGKRLVLTGLATTIATLAVVAVCAFFARTARAGGPIYVDADYTGVEMGSDSQPFNTIQEAHDASSNGVADVIYIKAATANPYASFSVSRGGYSPDAPDVYTVWPGTGSYPRISENVARLVYINASYVTIDGLDIDGSAGGSTGDLVRADSGSYITIRNCKVHDSALDEGIQLTHAPHAWVKNVESYNNAGDGINLCCGSYSSTVRFNYTHDNAGASAHGGFYFYEDGQSMDGLLVEHNVSVGNREAGINLRDVDGALIRNNLISGTLSNGARGVGILLNDSTTSNTVFNNTIFGSASDGVLVCDAEGLNNVILDNIIVSSTDYAIYATSPTQTVDYNLYWNSGVSETFNVATGTHSLAADPLFATGPDGPEPDFYLDPSSPAVDAGSQTAASAGLALCATRADRQSDQGIVDLGYHYPAMPYTLTLEADPSAITADGLATTIVTATLRTATGGPVADGAAVVFRTTAGYFGNWMEIHAAQTTNGVAVAVLNSVPSGASVTVTVGADAYGTSDETQVTFAAPACGADMTDWTESTANPIFGQGVDGGPKAYYPSVLYSPTAFDGHGDAAYYKMWFGASDSKTGYAISDDGLDWVTVTVPLAGINGYHAHVLYDAGHFGSHGDAAYYKMWYWDASNSINYATSDDGVNWTDYANNPVITNTLAWGSAPVYDAYVIYNDDGAPAYYEAWIDNNGKIYYITSADGITWTGDNQELLTGREDWESSTYSRVSVLKQDGVYHMWYGGASSGGGNDGIGYAVSTDGRHWVKSLDNPLLHIGDGPAWRDDRTYTPRVLYSATRFDGHGSPEYYKMWFTGRDSAFGNYTLGFAALNPVSLSATDTSGGGQSGATGSPLDQPFVVGLHDSCGEPASGVTVTFVISGAPAEAVGQSLSLASGATDGTGAVQTTLILGDLTGVYTVTATASGVTGLPAVFTAMAELGPSPSVSTTLYLPLVARNATP